MRFRNLVKRFIWEKKNRGSPRSLFSLKSQWAVRWLGPRRMFSAVAVIFPFRFPASMMSLLALMVTPKGFSVMMLTPASRQAMALTW